MFELPNTDSMVIHGLAKELEAGWRSSTPVALADDIDVRLAAALNVPPAAYANSLEDAFALRDIVFPNMSYLNVDFREYFYAELGGMSYICDVKHECGEGCGHGSTRARALVAALLMHVSYELEEARHR